MKTGLQLLHQLVGCDEVPGNNYFKFTFPLSEPAGCISEDEVVSVPFQLIMILGNSLQ